MPFEERVEGVKVNEEAEQMIEELIEEMEDEETIKVSEFVEIELTLNMELALTLL